MMFLPIQIKHLANIRVSFFTTNYVTLKIGQVTILLQIENSLFKNNHNLTGSLQNRIYLRPQSYMGGDRSGRRQSYNFTQTFVIYLKRTSFYVFILVKEQEFTWVTYMRDGSALYGHNLD
jgi:hypothetical protein